MLSLIAASTPLMPLFSVILSFLFAAVIIGAIALGLYLLFAPSDTLVVVYQNYHLRRSMRPLKDEDFASPVSIVRRLRCMGILSLLTAAALIVLLLNTLE